MKTVRTPRAPPPRYLVAAAGNIHGLHNPSAAVPTVDPQFPATRVHPWSTSTKLEHQRGVKGLAQMLQTGPGLQQASHGKGLFWL